MSSTVLLSPTEFDLHKKIPDAIVHSWPEKKGVDILIVDNAGLLGLQRKKYPEDFVASVRDGRLQREIPLMIEHLDFGALIIEGRPRFTEDGFLFDAYNERWTKQSLRNLRRSCMWAGVPIDPTDNIDDTVEAIEEWRQWWEKGEHMSLLRLPKKRDQWGRVDPSAILQAADKIGPKMAQRIYEHFGRVPLKWDCTIAEMMEIKGIAKTSAANLWNLFGDEKMEVPVRKKRVSKK